ncbi:hypothetical protein [Priestia megaterium]
MEIAEPLAMIDAVIVTLVSEVFGATSGTAKKLPIAFVVTELLGKLTMSDELLSFTYTPCSGLSLQVTLPVTSNKLFFIERIFSVIPGQGD